MIATVQEKFTMYLHFHTGFYLKLQSIKNDYASPVKILWTLIKNGCFYQIFPLQTNDFFRLKKLSRQQSNTTNLSPT